MVRRSRQRGFSNLATVLLAIVGGLIVSVLLMDWVVVDVETRGPDRVDLTIPVPLGAARLAMAFVPMDDADLDVPPEVRENKDAILAALRDLDGCPDGTVLVRVQAPDAKVLITKDRGLLRVDVDADDAVVHCALPLAAARRTLERWDWQRFDPKMALDLLAATPSGPLVAVDSSDARVRISMW